MGSRFARLSFACCLLTTIVFMASLVINYSEVYGGEADLGGKYVPNEVLVKFIRGASETEKENIRRQLGAAKIRFVKSINVEYWRLPKEVTVEEALQYLQNIPIVETAEPNFLYKTKAVPNDPDFGKQWYLDNTGQSVNNTTGQQGADVSLLEAWDLETGSKNVIIAVIDTGVAFDHPDLKDNVWTNEDEVPGNGLDDDQNGYVDDVHGWDFVNDDNNPSDYSRDAYGDGHGTHVAGILAAKGNNNIGC